MLRPLHHFFTSRLSPGSSAVLASLAIVTAAVACTDGMTYSGLTPITGVIVRSTSVTRGFGCGEGDTQVYKYAAIVVDSAGVPIAKGASIYDCFADASFVNLPTTTGVDAVFTIEIFAFNEGAFEVAKLKIFKDQNGLDRPIDFDLPEDVQTLFPTWSADCTGTQQRDVQVLAVCDPLALGSSGFAKRRTSAYADRENTPGAFQLPLGSFVTADGRPFACDDAVYASADIRARTTPKGAQIAGLAEFIATDSPCRTASAVAPPADAGANDAASDAGAPADAGAEAATADASDPDGGADAASDAEIVDSSPGPIDAAADAIADAAPSPDAAVAAPSYVETLFQGAPAYAPATYVIDVDLKNALKAVTHYVRCTAVTSPNVPTRARCEPVRETR